MLLHTYTRHWPILGESYITYQACCSSVDTGLSKISRHVVPSVTLQSTALPTFSLLLLANNTLKTHNSEAIHQQADAHHPYSFKPQIPL
eukprot:1161202-Pelagomonas_calceolata.AAC.2